MQELEKTIIQMKTDLIDKNSEINQNIKVINDLKEVWKQMETDLDSKEREILEKDKIINIIRNTHNNSDTEDEDSDDSVYKYVSKADCSDTNSTFDFAQLDLDVTDVIQEVKQKIRKKKASAVSTG